MASPLTPIERRDFRQGRITPHTVANSLVPQNSVKESYNVNFDEVVGSARVRPGTTVLGSSFVTSGFSPEGLAEFVPAEGGLGMDIVTNGAFTGNADGWDLGDGWTYGTNNVEWSLLGPELITNGSFTGGTTGWTLGTGWSYDSNNVLATFVFHGPLSTIFQGITFDVGSTYRLTYTVSNTNNGGLVARIGTGSTIQTLVSSANGAQTADIVAGSDNAFFIMSPSTGNPPFNGNIDDISVKLINTGLLSQDVGAISGQSYSITVTTGGTMGFVNVDLGGTQQTIPAGETAFEVTVTASSTVLSIEASPDFDGTVDDVKVQQQFNRLLLAVYDGAANASLYYYDGSTWNTSDLITLTNGFRNRFSTLGGYEFVTNAADGMFSSPDANTWGDGAPENCIDAGDAKPSLIYRYKQRLLAAGDASLPDRIYFSSIIDPTASPFITWNTDPATGDWIDVNPDDGGNITGFSENSTFLLVFKDTGMYRMDTVSKTVDPDNIYNIGAVSQEAIVLCMGVTYYFSGTGIYRTNGGYPEQISRSSVQDILEAMAPQQWENVRGGTDGLNVYFELGSITLNFQQTGQRTIDNIVLKFSPRDQSWSVHYYRDYFGFFAQYTDGNGSLMRGASDAGTVQTINLGTKDADVAAIPFYLESQDEEFGNRGHNKSIANNIVVYADNGLTSAFSAKQNGTNQKPIIMSLNQRVNLGSDINLTGNYFNFVWAGSSLAQPPILEGYYIETIQDEGIGPAEGVSQALPAPTAEF